MTSSFRLFVVYHNDARSNKHQVQNTLRIATNNVEEKKRIFLYLYNIYIPIYFCIYISIKLYTYTHVSVYIYISLLNLYIYYIYTNKLALWLYVCASVNYLLTAIQDGSCDAAVRKHLHLQCRDITAAVLCGSDIHWRIDWSVICGNISKERHGLPTEYCAELSIQLGTF